MKRTIRYGISYNSFGQPVYAREFATEAEAYKWLNTEEYDFRTRELMSKTAAIKAIGSPAKLNTHLLYC